MAKGTRTVVAPLVVGAERQPPVPPLTGFFILYTALYAALGAASPFLPLFIEARGISHDQIGMLFAAGTAIRLVSAPIAGRLADRTRALRLTLAGYAILTALAALVYLPARGFWVVLAVSLFYAFAVAPTTNLADALALVASRRPSGGFEYGWVRGAGSAAFVVGLLLAGVAMSTYGLNVIVWLQAVLIVAAAGAVRFVPPASAAIPGAEAKISRAGILTLLRLPAFRRIMLVSALILGSHAMYDTFAVISWRAAGISAATVSVLWSISVAAEVVVFFLIGPRLLRVLDPAGAIALAAVAGATRWLVAAFSADIVALALTQPLHGLTFALLHLACMRLLTANVPPLLAATAQTVYGTVGIGAATALLTLASGWLYAQWGAHAFLAMSALCLAALPAAGSLRSS